MNQQATAPITEEHVESLKGEFIEEGIRLSEKEYLKPYFEDKTAVEDEFMLAQTALQMEACRNWALNETRSSDVSGYIDQIFPVLRVAYPNLVLHQLVTVQPISRKNGQIYYMDYIVGRNKGTGYTKGQKLFDHRRAYPAVTDYTSTQVPNDNVGTAPGGVAVLAGLQTTEVPVTPNTMVVTFTIGAVAQVVYDTGNGALTNAAGTITGTLDYERGTFGMTSAIGNFDAGPIVANYNTDYEVNQELPTIDIQLSATGINTEDRAIRYRYSEASAYDFSQEFGRKKLDAMFLKTMSNLFSAEITYQVLQDLWNMAGAAAVTFSLTVPAGVTRAQHYASIVYQINQIGNLLFLATQRVTSPTWIVCDANAAAVLQTIPAPTFVAANIPPQSVGTHKLGTLQGITVYRDAHIGTFVGASPRGNMLVGYRGNDWLDAAYVWAPYQLFITTPETTLDDFLKRRAAMSRYGRKELNNQLILRLALVP